MPKTVRTLHPPKLKPGHVVALVAPSFRFERRFFEQGCKTLETQYGVRTVYQDDIFATDAYFAGSLERRVAELERWLTDPKVDAVMAIRGGYGCARLYPELLKRLKKYRRALKPKIVVGYSDFTGVLNGLYQDFGWVTFHGPMVAGRPFRDPVPLESETFHKALFSAKPLGKISDPEMGVLSPGTADGKLVGGCLTLLASAVGTDHAIKTKDKILFIEDVDERPYRLDRMLTQLHQAGTLDRVRAIVLGQLVNCAPPIAKPGEEPHPTAGVSALDAVRLALEPLLAKRPIPVVYNFPAGHGSPQATFPLGVTVEVRAPKTGAPTVAFTESAVK